MTERYDLDVRVRRAEMSDAAALADLMTQLGYTTRTSEMEMRMEAIQADKNYATFVAVKTGQGLGGVGTVFFFSYQDNKTGGGRFGFIMGGGGGRGGVWGGVAFKGAAKILRGEK